MSFVRAFPHLAYDKEIVKLQSSIMGSSALGNIGITERLTVLVCMSTQSANSIDGFRALTIRIV